MRVRAWNGGVAMGTSGGHVNVVRLHVRVRGDGNSANWESRLVVMKLREV